MSTKIFEMCKAYDAGFTKGQQLHQCQNPYQDAERSEAWQIGYDLGAKRAAKSTPPLTPKVSPEATIDLGKYAGTYGGYTVSENIPDPCPNCRKSGVCRTPACGRLKLPLDHPLRNTK